MKGAVTKPDFKITIGADSGQIEANVVKAINEAVASINKDTDTKLKKLKVQIDKEALKNQIQNSVSSVHIKQFDGLGKQIGNDIASAIKKSLANVQIGKISGNVSGTSTSGTAKLSNGLPSDRNKLINSWAKQYSEQEMKLYTAVADILNRSSKMATADYEKLLDQFQAYEDNLKQFSSNLTKRERNAFDTAVKTEQSKSKYDTFHMAKQTYDNMWGVSGGSLTDILRSIGGSVHPAVSKASYDLPKKLSSMLEYVPFDASNIDAGLDGITDKINEAVKSQISGMQILARNVKVESDSMSDSNKKIDEHVDVMKLAAEAEAKKAEQSKATGSAIAKETQNITKNNAAAKAHADILSGEEANPDYIRTLNDVGVAQGIQMNSGDIDKIAELATKQKKAGYELQAVSVDKVFDADGITNITGSLRYFNKELQTTVSQGYTAKKAMDAEEDGVYELKLAHERLIQTFKTEKAVNADLLKAQAESVKNQLYAQIESSHQPKDAVITDSIRSYFDDSFIVDTTDKLSELKRAISAAKANLSALEQAAKSGDSFNALTNQYEKFEKTPATLEKLTTAISKLKKSNVSILGDDINLTDKLNSLKKAYEQIAQSKSQSLSSMSADQQVAETEKRVKAIRDYLTEIRLLSGYVGAAKAVELNKDRAAKYEIDYDKMQSNMQKAEQSYNNLAVKSPELTKQLNSVKSDVMLVSKYFGDSAANVGKLQKALKEITALNSRIIAERGSDPNYLAQVGNSRPLWDLQNQGLAVDRDNLDQNQFTGQAVAAINEALASYEKVRGLIGECNALSRTGTSLQDEQVQSLKDAVAEYERLASIAQKNVSLVKKQAATEKTSAVNARNLQELETAYRNFLDQNGRLGKKSGLKAMADDIGKAINELKGTQISETDIANIRKRLSQLNSMTTELGVKGQSYKQRIGNKMGEIVSYFVSITSFGFAVQQIRNMIQNIVNLDDAMTDLRKVTDETDKTYEKFLSKSADRARELGSTMSNVVIATGSFARMGYNLEEAEKLGDAAIMAQNVWDNVGSVDETANTIISAMKAFGIAAEDAMRIVDVYNAVSNSFGVTSGNIADAMADAGSALEAAGNSFNDSVALFTATNEVIQDYSKTATALRTIAARIRNTSGELADMEIDADGAAESITQLQQKIYKASGNRVNIFEADNETFKSTIQILRELSEIWNTLSDVDQAEITRLVAGTRQQSVFAAIMNNFDTVDKVIETAESSAGSATAENEKYLESITGKLAILKSSYEALSNAIINSDLYKSGITLLTNVLNLLENIASVTGTGLLGSIAGGIAGGNGYGPIDLRSLIADLKAGQSFRDSLFDSSLLGLVGKKAGGDKDVLEGVIEAFEAAQKEGKGYKNALNELRPTIDQMSGSAAAQTKSILGTANSYDEGIKNARQYASTLKQVNIADTLKNIGLSAANAAIGIATGFAIGAAIDLAIKGIVALKNRVQNAIDAAADITKAWQEADEKLRSMSASISDISDSYSEFERLSKGVSQYGKNVSLTSDEYERYHELSNQIAETFPGLVVGYDDQLNAVVRLKNGVADLNAEYEKEAKLQRTQKISDFNKVVKGFKHEWTKSDFGSISKSEQIEILRTLKRNQQDLQSAVVELFGKKGPDDLVETLRLAGYDAGPFDDMIGQLENNKDIFKRYLNLLETELDSEFETQILPGINSYLYEDETFSALDQDAQVAISGMLSHIDDLFAADKTGSEIYKWIDQNIIDPLKDNATKDAVTNAINDIMSFDPSTTKMGGLLKSVQSLLAIVSAEQREALRDGFSDFFDGIYEDFSQTTASAYEKFGARFGQYVLNTLSDDNLRLVLNPDFEWNFDSSDFDGTKEFFEEFNKQFDKYLTKSESDRKTQAVNSAVDSYNKAVSEANRLYAAQELGENRLISDDVYDRIKDQNADLTATLERVDNELTGQHGWQIVDSEIEKYIETQKDAAEKTLRSNGALSEQYALLQDYLGGTNSIEERISAYAEANSKLGDAYDKVANKEQYAYSEMISLKETFPELQFELDETTGKYDLIGDSAVSLMKKNYEFIKSLQQQRLELLKLNAVDVFENSGWSESRAKQRVYTIVNQIDSNDLKSLQEYENSINGSVEDQDISDFVTRYTAALAEIEQAQADLDALIAKAPAGELKDKSKSSSSSETEFSKNLKQLNMEKEALESEMELDPAFVKYNLSSMEDYYSKLAAIAKAGYAAGEIDAVEYQGYVLDVFNGLREEVKKGYQKSFDTLSTEKKKFDEGMDWDKSLFATLRDYYTNLGELAKKAYNDGAIDADEYQDYLIEVFKGLKEASVKEYDDMLSKLEDERQKYDAGMVWDRSVFTDLSDYYDKIEKINDKRFKENLSTTSEYVDELVKIFEGRNEMLEKTLSDYEHDITLMQNRDSVNSSGIPESEVKQIETYRMMQEMVHKAADTYREQMTGTMSDTEIEHSEYIKDMQTKWWEYENNIQSIQSEMFDRSLSAYEDYISRRNKFGNWGADNEIAAWKRVDKFLDQSYENGIINYKTYLEKKLDVLESMYDAEKQRQQDFADAAVRIMEKELDALNKQKENYEKQKGNYESTVSAVVDLINDQIDKLKEESDELDKQLKLQKALKAVEEARSQHNIHIYRDNGTGFEWEADDKAVREAQESYDDLKREQDLNDQIDALEKYRDAWQATIDDYEKNIDKQKAMALLGADWEKQILDMRTDKIEGFARNYTDICDQLNEDVTGSVASQIKDLEDLKDEWSDAVDNIEYELGRYDELMDFEDEFRSAGLEQRKAMLEDFSKSGVQNLQNLINKANELQNALDSLNGINNADFSYGNGSYPTMNDDTAQKEQNIIDKMKENSAAWWFANESEQKTLADRNKVLGESLGWTRDENGVWWKKNGVRAYADGGLADYTGIAMIHGSKSRPELVLNNADAGYLYSMLHGRQFTVPTSPSVQKPGEMTVTIGDINLSGVNSPDTLAEAIVRQLPTRLIQKLNRK